MHLFRFPARSLEGYLMTDRVAYPDNPVMAICFAGFLQWAAEEKGVLDEFKTATGIAPFWIEKRTRFDAMIDAATGREKQDFDAFVDWLIESLWGESPWGEA